jgi:hypothetical protein
MLSALEAQLRDYLHMLLVVNPGPFASLWALLLAFAMQWGIFLVLVLVARFLLRRAFGPPWPDNYIGKPPPKF